MRKLVQSSHILTQFLLLELLVLPVMSALAGMASYLDAGSIVALGAGLAILQKEFALTDGLVGILAAIGPNALGCALGALIGGHRGGDGPCACNDVPAINRICVNAVSKHPCVPRRVRALGRMAWARRKSANCCARARRSMP